MLLNNKSITEITEDDLNSLVADQQAENRILEYKLCLPGNTYEEKKEFLADASSFANASGGFIVYGIQEDQGKPVALSGCAGDTDAEQLRLLSSIRDGVAPRIYGVDSHAVTLTDGRWVLILYIPKSLAGPHMVTYKNASRFFARNSSGKYQLDVHELRSAFALSEDLRTRLRNFRLERLAKIVGRETPIPLADGPKIVVHIIPVASFQGYNSFDIKPIARSSEWLALAYEFASLTRYNLDGLLGYRLLGNSELRGYASHYIQLYRDGAVEAVDSYMLREDRQSELWIPYTSLEEQFIPFCANVLTLQRRLGLEPPLLIFWSMTGVRGFKMPPSDALPWHFTSAAIDRDTLLLPEVWLDQYPKDLVAMVEILRTPLDALWNATGSQEWLTYGNCRKRAIASDQQTT